VTFSPISRAKLGVAADDPFFNDEAAAKMYHEISKMDQDEATVLLQMAAFHVAARDLTLYGDQFESEFKQVIEKRAERVKGALTRNLVSKGKDPAPYLAALDDISKAVNGPTDFDISERVKRQWRDPGGRFRVMTQKIEPNILDKPLKDGEANKLGIPKPSRAGGTTKTLKLDEQSRKNFQGDYYQVLSMLNTIQNDPITAKGAVVTLNYSDGDSSQFLTSDGKEKLEEKFAGEKYAEGKRVISVDTSFLREENPQIDLMSAIGTPGGAARNRAVNYISDTEDADQKLVGYRKEMERTNASDAYNPADRAYRRLGATAGLLSGILPDSAVKTQLALNAARWAGFNATEVERVVGPGARKVAYRYRGIEKTPTPGLQKTIDAYLSSNKDKSRARDLLINGSSVDVVTPRGIRQEFKESPIINYLVKDLPKKELVNLQTKSGAMPPSRGYIIDRNGKIITEAVGYGDDHYLPFNLKNISKLKGGEYVRTRTLGGPTTEDIYAGLISGARSVTVVSRSGIYTVEFDEAFRGSRRYNDKAARMVGRYGMILDAVKSKKVTLDTIPPDRLQELEESAGSLYDQGSDGYARELDRLKSAEKANPQMSEERRQETAREFLRDVASRRTNKDGNEMTYEEMVEELARKDLNRANAEKKAFYSSFGAPELGDTSEDELKQKISSNYRDPETIVNTMGLDDEYNKYFATQMKTYKASQAPLQLDGPGYAFALDAMKEQFPYYIKSVKYRQLNQDASSGREDVGYVKPRFTRPEGVKAGYYDQSITGAGKIKADQLNYQNVSVTGKDRAAGGTREYDANTEETSAPEERKYESPKVDMPTMGDSRKAAAKNLREAFQKRTKTDRQYKGKFANEVPAGSDLDSNFKNQFPYIFGMSDYDFNEAWEDNPTVVEEAVNREIAEFSGFFSLGNNEENLIRRFKNGGKSPVIKFDRNNPPIREALNGAKFDFGDELYMPGIAPSRIEAKIKDGRDISRAKAIVVSALEGAGYENPRELVNNPGSEITDAVKVIMRDQSDIVKAVQRDKQNLGNRQYSDTRADEELQKFEEIVKYIQLRDNYVESVTAEIERQRERQMIEAGAATPKTLILNIDNPDAAEAFRNAAGLKAPGVFIDQNGNPFIDENGEPIVTV